MYGIVVYGNAVVSALHQIVDYFLITAHGIAFYYLHYCTFCMRDKQLQYI